MLNDAYLLLGYYTQNTGSITVKRDSGGDKCRIQGFNFTGIDKLTIDCKNNQASIVRLEVNIGGVSTFSTQGTTRQTFDVDVSAISGTKDITLIEYGDTGSTYVYNITAQ